MSHELSLEQSNLRHLFATLIQYRPFIVACLLVLIATYSLGWFGSTGGFILQHQLMNDFMSCFFLVFAAPKLINVSGFAHGFQEYDIIAKRVPNYARAYPFIEVFLGFVLLSGVSTDAASLNIVINAAIIVMTGVGIIGIAQSLRRKQQIFCACLGSSFKLPLSKVSLFENVLMLSMSLYMIVFYQSFHLHVVSLMHLGNWL